MIVRIEFLIIKMMNYTIGFSSPSSRPFHSAFFFYFLVFHTVLYIIYEYITIILSFYKNNRWSVCSSREKIKFKLIKRFWTAELSSHKRIFRLKRSVFNSVCELVSFFSVSLNRVERFAFYTYLSSFIEQFNILFRFVFKCHG